MIRQTGGRLSAAISTRSSPRSRARRRASGVSTSPACSPFSSMSRMGVIRIRSFMRGPVGRMSSRPNPLRRMAMARSSQTAVLVNGRGATAFGSAVGPVGVVSVDAGGDEGGHGGSSTRPHDAGQAETCMRQQVRGRGGTSSDSSESVDVTDQGMSIVYRGPPRFKRGEPLWIPGLRERDFKSRFEL